MAGVALDRGVASPQREFRLVVIEVSRLPLALIVACFAFGAVAIGVHVLQAVAGDAS